LCFVFFFSSRRRHTRFSRDWSSDVCSSDLSSSSTRRGTDVTLEGGPRAGARPDDAALRVRAVVDVPVDDLVPVGEGTRRSVAERSEERRVGKESTKGG